MNGIDKSLESVFNNLENGLKNIKIDTSKEGITNAVNSSPQLKKTLLKLRAKEKAQPLNEEVTTALIISVLIAVPKIAELIGKAIKSTTSESGIFTKIKRIFNKNSSSSQKGQQIGNYIIKASHKLHNVYIKGIKLSLGLIPGFNDLEDHAKDKVSAIIFNTVVAGLLIHSGLGAYHSLSHGDAGLGGVELVLAAIKNGELEAYLSEAIGMAILSLSFDSTGISHNDSSNTDTSSFTGFKASTEKKVYRPNSNTDILSPVNLKNKIKTDIKDSLKNLEYGLFEGEYLINKNNLGTNVQKFKNEILSQIQNIKQELIDEEQSNIERTGNKRNKTMLNIFKNMSVHTVISSKGKYAIVKIDYVLHGKHNPYEKH